MTIDSAIVGRVARLARIKVTEAEKETLAVEMNNILKLAEQLNEVDTKNVQPLTSVVQMELVLREDKVTDGGIAEKITANAPEHTTGFFVVPKVVE
jgi:aspartyl-tRNA(Asn)/glutamyl-tRNA(Gln) amidotransferase subunit C